MAFNKYQTIIAEFDLIVAYARSVDATLTGKKPVTEREGYVAEVFVKLLAHCLTMRTIAPDLTSATKKQLWDLGSLAAIARCVIETYDSLSYIAGLGVTDEERGFRLLLWSLHDSNRRMHMLQCIGTFDHRYHDLAAKEQRLHEKVVGHAHFAHIAKGLQKKILQREPPESYLSIKERCLASDVNHDYYTAATMQLSQFVHTFPYAVHQLFGFKAGSPQALQLMGLPLQYAMAFLSKALSDLRALFPSLPSALDADVNRKMQVWCMLLRVGPKGAA